MFFVSKDQTRPRFSCGFANRRTFSFQVLFVWRVKMTQQSCSELSLKHRKRQHWSFGGREKTGAPPTEIWCWEAQTRWEQVARKEGLVVEQEVKPENKRNVRREGWRTKWGMEQQGYHSQLHCFTWWSPSLKGQLLCNSPRLTRWFLTVLSGIAEQDWTQPRGETQSSLLWS